MTTTYKYRALSPRGRVRSGTLAAHNERDLQQQLIHAGMALIEARPFAGTSTQLGQLRPVGSRDLMHLCLNLEQLLRAGVTITDALRDTADAATIPRLRAALEIVLRDVSHGAALSHALGQHPRIFPPLMVALIAAGEATGRLAASCGNAAAHFRWAGTLRQKLLRVTLYPVFSLIVIMLVSALLLGYVVPQVGVFLASLGVPLPSHTLLLLSFANFLANNAATIGITLLFAEFIVTITLRRSTEARYQASACLLRLPVIGPLVAKTTLARFMHTFALLFGSGLALTDAMAIASRTVANPVIAEALETAGTQVDSGNPLSLALKLSGDFPGLVLRMLKIGEDSGDMAGALHHAADYYERAADDAMQTALGIIGPALTLLAGGLLMWIAAAIFIPIYSSLPQLMH